MIFYRLGISPGEGEAEGEDHDEWFTSLEAAKIRRTELIAMNDDLKYGCDYGIRKTWIGCGLSRKKLILALLNREGFVDHDEDIVAPYYPPPETSQQGEDLE